MKGHPFCFHTKLLRDITYQLLYGGKYKEHVITSFKNCSELVTQICDEQPGCIGDYNLLVKSVWEIKHYSPETIDRCYRKLVELGEIKEPLEIRVRKHKTEEIMHDINKWSPSPSDTDYNQKILLEDKSN